MLNHQLIDNISNTLLFLCLSGIAFWIIAIVLVAEWLADQFHHLFRNTYTDGGVFPCPDEQVREYNLTHIDSDY